MDEYILAGDIGGTKANLALFTLEDARLRSFREQTHASADFASLHELIRAFLGDEPPSIGFACLGIAGPVRGGRVETPNLPWVVDREELGRKLGLPEVTLINDLLATAYGIGELPEASFAVLNPGAAQAQGAMALIAAGTGLGEAILYWDGQRHVPSPSEGGHADFAPRGEEEIELLRFLDAQFGRTSFERVLSGPGLCNIYRFLVETGRGTQPPWLARRMAKEDPSAVIAEAGLQKADPVCARALEIFAGVYGSEAGNLALKALATRGIYVGGGIAPKILPKLEDGTFLGAFMDKGRLRDLLSEVPVRVILDPKTALYGAGRYAALGRDER